MAQFSYRALNKAGELVTGNIEADNKKDASSKLSRLNFTPLNVEKKSKLINFDFSVKPKVKPENVIVFTRQLQSLLKAGVPLLDAIKALSEQSADEDLLKVLQAISGELEMGNSFSYALKKHPKVFSELYVNTISIGESTGNLDEILADLYVFLEDDLKLRKDIKKATRYPILVISALILAFFVFIIFVIPKFTPIFEKSGEELPLPTQIILGISDVMSAYWFIIIIVVIATVVLFTSFYRTPKGKFIIDLYLLKIPIYGTLLQKISIQRFSKTLAILSRAGIPLVQAIEIAVKIETNAVYVKEINNVHDLIEKGMGVGAAMKRSKFFPNLMVHMVLIGEKSGALDEMLMNVADFNNSEIKSSVDNLTAMIEPIVTVFLGIMVLILALSIFLPMWNMLSFIK